MSPNRQRHVGNPRAATPKGGNPSDNLYTVILAVAFCIVLAITAFVAYKCYSQYNTIFGIPKGPLSRSGSAREHYSQLTIDSSVFYYIKTAG